MKTFKLVGLPEALLGKSEVEASSFTNLLENNPILKTVTNKITVKGNIVMAFDACDG